jgi:hypothetical protein
VGSEERQVGGGGTWWWLDMGSEAVGVWPGPSKGEAVGMRPGSEISKSTICSYLLVETYFNFRDVAVLVLPLQGLKSRTSVLSQLAHLYNHGKVCDCWDTGPRKGKGRQRYSFRVPTASLKQGKAKGDACCRQ